MRIIVLCIPVLFACQVARSQIKALTENGREVILYDNGTWKYSGDSSNASTAGTDSLATNEHRFAKPVSSSFMVRSNNFNVGVYIDPTKWTFKKHGENEDIPEYHFNMKQGDGYGMMITERTSISIENMRQIALINGRKASADIKETFAEYRMVNNKKILCMKMDGTIQGIRFVYFGYYYSNAKGTVQLLTYTSQQLFEKMEKDLENFLNGFVETDK